MNNLVAEIKRLALGLIDFYIDELKKYTEVKVEDNTESFGKSVYLPAYNVHLNVSSVATKEDFDEALKVYCQTPKISHYFSEYAEVMNIIICTYENTYRVENDNIEIIGPDNMLQTRIIAELQDSLWENLKFVKSGNVTDMNKLEQLGFVKVGTGEMYSKPEYIKYCEYKLGFSPLGELETKVMDILELGTFSAKEIAKELGLKVKAVNTVLKELISEGFVIKSTKIKQDDKQNDSTVRIPLYSSIANV